MKTMQHCRALAAERRNMNDKELLELAAKAAGMNAGGEYVDGGDEFTHLRVQRAKGQKWFKWNPLTDDGDALRLAVKLNIEFATLDDLRQANAGVWSADAKPYDCMTPYNGDKQAAVRRAIVRAAAASGEAMQ